MADDKKNPRTVPAVIDTNTPSIARAYDAYLDGKDNFQVDRDMVEMSLAVLPEAKQMARENRAWLIRAARFLASEAGIDQFLDCGSGLPSAENTHQATQRINPNAVCVYVDNDPACEAFGRALLEENEQTHFLQADLRTPNELLADPRLTKHIDLERPVGLIQCSTFHHIADEENPREIMAAYIDALPSGSYVAFTHFYDQEDGGYYTDIARRFEQVLQDSNLGSGFWRPKATLESYLEGLELVEPGFSLLRDWWPDGPHIRPMNDSDQIIIGVVGRKP